MTTLETRTGARLSIPRRILGGAVTLLLIAAIAGYTLGQVRSDDVFLRHYFGNPVLGAIVVLVLVIVDMFVLMPVRNEAVHHGRLMTRMVLFGLLMLSLIVFGFVQILHVFTYTPEVVAHSPDGRLSVAFVDLGNPVRRPLHLIKGNGFGARDVASLGAPCGLDVSVTFQGDDTVIVDTPYGTFKLRLDPATGQPLNVIGESCSPTG